MEISPQGCYTTVDNADHVFVLARNDKKFGSVPLYYRSWEDYYYVRVNTSTRRELLGISV